MSGGRLTQKPIVFSSDSKLFYLAKDNTLAVYNVETSEMIQTLAASQSTEKPTGKSKKQGQTTQITSVIAGPGRRVYTFTENSRVHLWDADQGQLLDEWVLDTPAQYVVKDPLNEGVFYCVMWKNHKSHLVKPDKIKYLVNRVALLDQGETKTEPVMSMKGTTGLAIRDDGRWLAAYSSFKVVLVNIRPNRMVTHEWSVTERISTLQFQPNEPVLAVGDWRGRIMFWYCLDDELIESTQDRAIVQHPRHWHAHRVSSLQFTESGTTMLSGGQEGVLVLWQLGSDTKSFIPRLGSDLVGIAISPDQMYYGVTLKDNSIQVFSSMNKTLVSSLQGLKYHTRATELIVHPTTNHLVLNGEPGCLQIFNPMSDRHLASIEVAAFNRTGHSGTSPQVDMVRYSPDGVWMATVDSRDAESFLKFWRWDPSDQLYRLATRVDTPHQGGITSVAFHPSGHQCVSTGNDQRFRVWELQQVVRKHSPGPHEFWVCRDTGRYRELVPRACGFSNDGSALAVAFGNTITIWDVNQNQQGAPVAVLLSSGTSQKPLQGVSFIGSTHYLAAWSQNRLDIFNMLTATVWWTLAVPLVSVYVHPATPLLALVSCPVPHTMNPTSALQVFNPHTPNPLVSLPITDGSQIKSAALIPPSSRSNSLDPLMGNSLVSLTSNGHLCVYGLSKDQTKTDAKGTTARKQKFSSIFGQQQQQQGRRGLEKRQALRLVKSALQSTYLNAPYHVLPPVLSLYDQFVSTQLPRPVVTPKSEEPETVEDVEMTDATPTARFTNPTSSAFATSISLGFKYR